MTDQQPKLDFENFPAPGEGILMTHFLIVRDVARSRAFYADVLGGQVVLDENPCVVKLANGWIIMNPGGGPTPDKPRISVVPYEPSDEVSTFLNLRVADIDACYRDWKSQGGRLRDRADRPRGGGALLHARSRRLSDRGGA